jgi:hypothetical protein
MLGFANAGRDSNCYLDAFFPVERKNRTQKLTEYFLKFHKLPDRLTHIVLWNLVSRFLETTFFNDELAECRTALRCIDWDHFTRFRNAVLYHGAYWPFADENEKCDMLLFVCHPDILGALDSANAKLAPFAADYFVAGKLFRRTLHLMLADIAKLAPALRPEADAIQTLPSQPRRSDA